LVGSVFSLTALSELTHLELGGGVPDGYEYGYNKYGYVKNSKFPLKTFEDDGEFEDDEGDEYYYHGTTTTTTTAAGGGGVASDATGGEAIDLFMNHQERASKCLDITSHEYRVTIKGVSGRLVDLKAFPKLVVLNLR
jgi:hypothetical protein